MQLSELLTSIQHNLGNPANFDTTLATEKINFILREDLYSRGLRPMLTKHTFTTVADQEYVALPTGFYRIHSDDQQTGLVFITDGGDGYVAMRMFPASWWKYVETSKPRHYRVAWNSTLTALALYLRAIPDAAYAGFAYCECKETALSADADEANISKVFGDMPLIAGATAELALTYHKPELEEKWRKKYLQEVAKLMTWQGTLEGIGVGPDEPATYDGSNAIMTIDYNE